jgi:hypothetical protein
MSSVQFDNKRVQRFLKGLSKNTEDIKKRKKAYVGGISAFVFRDVMRHFERELGPDGRWQSWSKSYKEHMAKRGKAGNKILQDTGRMRQSFKPTNNRSTDQGIEWFNNATTKEGFAYAYAHNEGVGKLPERRFMWLSDRALNRITRFTLEFMVRE